ncbi:MAG TPA: DNA-processing protein DprA [Vicinamibacterales bacterium]|nr:DNA-processing protein DprA [Vicinamibacterales bacterium]
MRALVAISLLSGGMNSLPARYAKMVLADSPPGLALDVIAGLMWKTRARRPDALEQAWEAAGLALRQTADLGASVLSTLERTYPDYLREIADPPVVLWIDGATEALSSPCVAIVGSRDALPASIEVARRLARGLAEAGMTIVSGLARGIDTAAHEGALEGGGMTVAVLGSGLGRIYPAANEGLARRIARTGAIVTELPPDSPPHRVHFPMRNRIISGLSRGTIVVEASEDSGSLITANQALDQNRSVMAVPGGTLAGMHRGCHALLKEGARLVESVEDVLDELNWPRQAQARTADSLNHLQLSDLEANMAEGELYSADQLAGVTGRTVPDLLTDLSLHELSGRVARTPGGQFVRLSGAGSRAAREVKTRK